MPLGTGCHFPLEYTGTLMGPALSEPNGRMVIKWFLCVWLWNFQWFNYVFILLKKKKNWPRERTTGFFCCLGEGYNWAEVSAGYFLKIDRLMSGYPPTNVTVQRKGSETLPSEMCLDTPRRQGYRQLQSWNRMLIRWTLETTRVCVHGRFLILEKWILYHQNYA